MALSPTYTRLIDYVLPTITGSHSDFVMLLKYDDFNVSDALHFIDQGGGDLRFSSDESGNNQLPCEVVEFDKVGNLIQVWVKIPNASTGQVIYIWGDNTGDSQPAVTDTYGRNAVWTSLVAHYSLNDNSGVDSTGSNPLSATATNTVSGAYGNAQQFSGQVYDGSITGLNTTTRYISAWVKPDSLTNNQYISTLIGGSKSNLTAVILGYQDGFINAYDEGYPTGNANQTALAVSTTQWSKFVYQWDSGRIKGYLDGVEIFDYADTMLNQTPTQIRVGSSSASDFYLGAMQGYEVGAIAKSASLIATEYQNQSTAGAWGTPTRVGGGAVTYDFELLSNSASSQFNNLNLAYNRLFNINTLSSNAQFNSLTLNYNRALKLNTLSSTAQFSNLTLEYVQLGTTYNFELSPLNTSAGFDDLNLSYNRLFNLNTLSSNAVFSDLDFSSGLLFALNSLSSTAQFNQVQLTHNRVLNINPLTSSASFKSINIDYSGFIEQRIDNYSIAYASDLITVNYQNDLIKVSYKD